MKKILALLLFVCALCTLTACGGSKLEGEWKFESMTQSMEGETMTINVGDDMGGVKATADLYVITVDKDGNATLSGEMMESEESKCVFEEDGDGWKLYELDEDGNKEEDSITATIEDGKLVLSQDNDGYSMKIVLVKQ